MTDASVKTIQKPAGRDILDIEVAWLDWPQAFVCLREALAADGQTVFAFLNANNANLAIKNTAFRNALAHSIILPDGLGVDMAARALHGSPFPANLNGTDFIPALFTYLREPRRVALIGARPDVLAKTAQAFQQHCPWHEFTAVSDGFFDGDGGERALAVLSDLQPDIVLVAMGSPLQELWIEDNIRGKHGKVVFGVGALFDFVSGAVPRAPSWIRRLRCEWVFRLYCEPRRLWRRYLIGNPIFFFRVLRYKYFGRKDTGRPAAV